MYFFSSKGVARTLMKDVRKDSGFGTIIPTVGINLHLANLQYMVAGILTIQGCFT
jgi:hypothetical protein